MSYVYITKYVVLILKKKEETVLTLVGLTSELKVSCNYPSLAVVFL